MCSPILTIAIPTYNRFEAVCSNITRLVPQLTAAVCVLVIDNASTDNTHNLVDWVRANHPDASIRVIRNITNVGAGANVTRCFELVATPWVWTLMDDDPVEPDAVAGILDVIARNPTAAYINMQSTAIPDELRRPADLDVYCSTTADLAEKLDFMPNLVLSSTGVFRVTAARAVLRKAYINLNTVAPHVAIQLSILEAGLGAVILSGHTVVTYHLSTDDPWSTAVWLAVADVFNLVRDQRARAILLRKYTQTHPGWVDTRKLLRVLRPLMLDSSTRQMAISDYLYAWSKRIQFTKQPVLLLIAFVVEALTVAGMILCSLIIPIRREAPTVESDAFLRTAIDGKA
ncbi:MAG: glycosyltransferase family 2 protein [Armatimonadota bacterium]